MNRTIELKATGESVTFVKTAEETNGEFVEIMVTLKSGGKGPGPHIHHMQAEVFEILEGNVGLMKNNQKLTLKPGQKEVVEPGTMHDFWCAGDSDIKFKATLTPALNFEWMLREIFESCNRRNSAEPSPYDGSYVISKLKGEYTLGDIPKFVQHYIFPVIAGFGKMLGLVKANPPFKNNSVKPTHED